MVDEGRVTRLLRGITARTGRLRSASERTLAQRDELWLDGIKYLFVITIEGCVDVAQHVASSEGFRPPDSNADALRLLGQQHVIDAALASELASVVGFRNVLVHQYAVVDDALVVAALDRLDVFDRFTSDVSAWMLGPPP